MADIIQRPVTIIMPNLEDGSETSFTFVPGFEPGKYFTVCFFSLLLFYASMFSIMFGTVPNKSGYVRLKGMV